MIIVSGKVLLLMKIYSLLAGEVGGGDDGDDDDHGGRMVGQMPPRLGTQTFYNNTD